MTALGHAYGSLAHCLAQTPAPLSLICIYFV